MSEIRKVINYRERQGTYRAALEGLSASANSAPELAATAVMRKWLDRNYGDGTRYVVEAAGTARETVDTGSVLVVAKLDPIQEAPR